MKIKNVEIDSIALSNLLQQFFVLRLYLFGSVLTENFSKHSDIDILIEFQEDKEIGYFDLLELQRKLQILFKRKIDLVEKASLINPFRKDEILRTSRLIYGE